MIIYALESDKTPTPPYSRVKIFPGHTCLRENQVKQFLSEHQGERTEWVFYDTLAMDYVPIEMLKFIDDRGEVHDFTEKFKSELEYMYPGEVILNLHKEK